MPLIVRVFATSSLGMALGALVIGIAVVTRQPASFRMASAVLGFLSISGSAGLALWRLRSLLAEDLYLAVDLNGLLLHLPQATAIPWDSIALIALDATTGRIVVHLRSGGSHTIEGAFAGITNADLAKSLETDRRKASFSLLRL